MDVYSKLLTKMSCSGEKHQSLHLFDVQKIIETSMFIQCELQKFH
jgi:hypothetical protein